MKKIFLILLGLCILGGILFVGFRIFEGNKYKNLELIGCSYSHGGGMLGDVSNITLKKIDDTTAEVTTNDAPTHADRIVTKVYKTDVSSLEEVKKMMLEYNLFQSSKKGKSPFEVLDAPSTSLSFDYENYEDDFGLADWQNLSAKDFEGINKIRDYLYSLCQGEAITSLEPHEISLQIDGYNLIYLMNECQATEDLLEQVGLHAFESYGDNEKIFYADPKLDVSGCPLAESGEAGTMAYYEPWGDVVFFYDEYKPAPGLYELGKLEYCTESALEFIKNMEDKEYYIQRFK